MLDFSEKMIEMKQEEFADRIQKISDSQSVNDRPDRTQDRSEKISDIFKTINQKRHQKQRNCNNERVPGNHPDSAKKTFVPPMLFRAPHGSDLPLRNVLMVVDMILAVYVISIAAGAIAESHIRIVQLGDAADGAAVEGNAGNNLAAG